MEDWGGTSEAQFYGRDDGVGDGFDRVGQMAYDHHAGDGETAGAELAKYWVIKFVQLKLGVQAVAQFRLEDGDSSRGD